MKLLAVAVLLLGSLIGSRTSSQDLKLDPAIVRSALLLEGREWAIVAEFPIDKAQVTLIDGRSGMGASSCGVRFDNYVQGTALVDLSARPALTVFLGWNPPEKYLNAAPEDVRVIFYQADGTPLVTKYAAGGACGLMFRSPDRIAPDSLVRFQVCRPMDAEWIRQ